MRRFVWLVGAGLLVAVGILGYGQGIDPTRIKAIVERMDVNGDGIIEKGEVPEGQRALFLKMLDFADANEDGKLDRTETAAILERAQAQGKAGTKEAAAQVVRQALRGMDKNGDGKVSRDEFTSHAGYFDRLDANHDGFLAFDEVGPAAASLLNRNVPFVPPPRETTGLVPLTELSARTYQGKEGGLYPNGSNVRPEAHEALGLRLAPGVEPLDGDGKPAAEGSIVLLSIGMSNTTQEFSSFVRVARADAAKNPRLTLVDGAQGGMTASVISQPKTQRGHQFWSTVDDRLKQAGVTRAQVQAAWLKEADGMPTATIFPDYALTLEKELYQIAQIAAERFPNLRLLYLSSRIYGGYAKTPLNPEPFAYESAFAVKWLIEKQLAGDPGLRCDRAQGPAKAPWLAWGPYLWADGTHARADGLRYAATDFAEDGTHPAEGARQKVAGLLLDFFKTDRTTKRWFTGQE